MVRGKNRAALDCLMQCRSFIMMTLSWIPDCHTKASPNFKPPPRDYIWRGTISDLIELSIALHKTELLCKPSGEPMTYAQITTAIQEIFGVKIPNIYSRKTRILERKKSSSPFLDKLLVLYQNEMAKTSL
jgi:hypothetical protein